MSYLIDFQNTHLGISSVPALRDQNTIKISFFHRLTGPPWLTGPSNEKAEKGKEDAGAEACVTMWLHVVCDNLVTLRVGVCALRRPLEVSI